MRWMLVLVGLLMIALSAAWYLTDLPSEVRYVLTSWGIIEPETRTLGSSGIWSMLKTGLDVANAIIGCIGIFLTLRARRKPSAT